MIEFAIKPKDIAPPGGLQSQPTSRRCCAATSHRRAHLEHSTSCRSRTAPSRPTCSRATWSCWDRRSGDCHARQHGDSGCVFARLLGPYVLSDGGLVRNLPVDVARNLCADVVIAVNLVSPPVKPDQLLGAGRLAGRSMEVMLGANEVLQLQSLTARRHAHRRAGRRDRHVGLRTHSRIHPARRSSGPQAWRALANTLYPKKQYLRLARSGDAVAADRSPARRAFVSKG